MGRADLGKVCCVLRGSAPSGCQLVGLGHAGIRRLQPSRGGADLSSYCSWGSLACDTCPLALGTGSGLQGNRLLLPGDLHWPPLAVRREVLLLLELSRPTE